MLLETLGAGPEVYRKVAELFSGDQGRERHLESSSLSRSRDRRARFMPAAVRGLLDLHANL